MKIPSASRSFVIMFLAPGQHYVYMSWFRIRPHCSKNLYQEDVLLEVTVGRAGKLTLRAIELVLSLLFFVSPLFSHTCRLQLKKNT